MLIVNFQRLDYAAAIGDEKHPMHAYAKEYDQGLRELRKKYPEGHIRLLRNGFPKFADSYIDGKGKEYRDVPEDVPPMRFSLRANVSHPVRGKESWGVCLGAPEALPGGLWDVGSTKSKQITNGLTVDLVQDADLAYFLYYKSPHVTKGHWRVDDPKAEVRAKGDVERERLETKTAIWQQLTDETQLRTVAAAYGIDKVATKEPDAIRFELETILERNNDLKKKDPSYKGTKEFLEDLKINDFVRLSAFVRHWMDEGMIRYNPDGRFKIGDEVIAHVPQTEISKKFPWLCNYLGAPNNKEKLQELFKDVVNKDYLDTLSDNKDFRWIAGVMDIPGYYNKNAEEVKQMVYSVFVL